MGDGKTFAERLRNGLAKIDGESGGGLYEGDALATLRRSVVLTLARLEQGVESTPFKFQNTGGKPLLLQGIEALPLEPERLFSMLNAMDIHLQPGEALDLDGGLAAWLIRPEVNATDSNCRQAEESLRVLKLNRESRDHAAVQAADSVRIRLRTRLVQLVGALGMANKIAENPGPAVKIDRPTTVRPKEETAVRPAPPPPPKPETAVRPAPSPPPPKTETAVRPAPLPSVAPPEGAKEGAPPVEAAPPEPTGPSAEVLGLALRRIMAVVDGCGFKSAVISDVAHLSWGFTEFPVWSIELIVGLEEKEREPFLSAARGEGLYLASGSSGSVSLRYVDKKAGTTADVEVIFATTPAYLEIVNRAKPDYVLNAQVRVASCEDLIVLRCGSEENGHRDSVIHLLRTCAARIDPTYLKAMAQKFDVLDELKSAWQEAKKQITSPTEASES